MVQADFQDQLDHGNRILDELDRANDSNARLAVSLALTAPQTHHYTQITIGTADVIAIQSVNIKIWLKKNLLGLLSCYRGECGWPAIERFPARTIFVILIR